MAPASQVPAAPAHAFSPAERDRLEARMFNWARWVLDDPKGPKGHCGSAEGRFESPREDQVRFEKSAQEPIDILDAGRIEMAVTSLQRTSSRMFVMSWFVYRSHPVAMSKRFKIAEWQLPGTLWAILGAVQYRLDRQPIAQRSGTRYKGAEQSSVPPLQEAIGSR